MNKIFSIVLIAAGIVLSVVAINASNDLFADVTDFSMGAPPNHAVWIFISGILAATLGAALCGLKANNRLLLRWKRAAKRRLMENIFASRRRISSGA